jgi:hypothetical protein
MFCWYHTSVDTTHGSTCAADAPVSLLMSPFEALIAVLPAVKKMLVRLNSTLGRTKCVNTFTGYACECGEGFMKVVDAATGVDTCSEINECLVRA